MFKFLLCCAFVSCVEANTRMVSGSPVTKKTIKDFRYHVQIGSFVDGSDFMIEEIGCGGTLITLK